MQCTIWPHRHGLAIVCGRFEPRIQGRRCAHCSKPHTTLCDGDLGNGRTCDLPMCVFHVAAHVEPNLDFCVQHAPAASHG